LEVGLTVGLKVKSVVFLASSNDGNDIDETATMNFEEVGEGKGVRPLITTRLEKKRISIRKSRAIFTGCKSDGGEPLTRSTPTSLNPCKFRHQLCQRLHY
jgi:hypothetical protein